MYNVVLLTFSPLKNRSGSDQTLKAYKDNAKKTDPKSPDTVNGGVVHDKPTTPSSMPSASAVKKSEANLSGASNLGLTAVMLGMMLLL